MSADMPIRLIATDMDGTLLNSQGVIPPENIQAIRDAQKKGIVVAIATGRFPENAYFVLKDLGLSCPIIGTNGAKVMNENLHVVSQHYMRPEAAQAVHDVLVQAGANYFIFGENCICTALHAEKHHSELSQGPRIEALGFSFLHGPEAARACCQQPVNKFFVCNNVPLPPIREKLSKIPGIELTQSSERNIEVMPEGVDKGVGVRDLAAQLNIPLSQVMTLGDQENDIPMLRVAGYGVAMGNASESTKAVARYVTNDNNHAGWAKAVAQYAL